jgi:hypothetical protein
MAVMVQSRLERNISIGMRVSRCSGIRFLPIMERNVQTKKGRDALPLRLLGWPLR